MMDIIQKSKPKTFNTVIKKLFKPICALVLFFIVLIMTLQAIDYVSRSASLKESFLERKEAFVYFKDRMTELKEEFGGTVKIRATDSINNLHSRKSPFYFDIGTDYIDDIEKYEQRGYEVFDGENKPRTSGWKYTIYVHLTEKAKALWEKIADTEILYISDGVYFHGWHNEFNITYYGEDKNAPKIYLSDIFSLNNNKTYNLGDNWYLWFNGITFKSRL